MLVTQALCFVRGGNVFILDDKNAVVVTKLFVSPSIEHLSTKKKKQL